MSRRTWIVATLLLTIGVQAGSLAAQRADSLIGRTPSLVRYGKWVTLAGAVGMGILAARSHNSADDSFEQLRQYCFPDNARCDQSSNGSYLDPVAEGYYQSSVRHDRQARRWLLGGEVALLGSAGLFVWELTRPKAPPKNIPFEPTLTVTPRSTLFGIRASF
jgi:hypothetical protein